MNEKAKWTWDPENKVVVIHECGEYFLGISETQYITVRVEVGSGSKDVSEKRGGEAQ